MMKACPKCGESTEEAAKFCSHCGASLEPAATPAEENKPANKWVAGCQAMTALLIFFIMAGVGLRSILTDPPRKEPSSEKPAPTGVNPYKDDVDFCLAKRTISVVDDGFSTKVHGSITNNCSKTFRYVEVTYKLLDREDAIVGTALANNSNFAPKEVWKFQAIGFGENVARARLDRVQAME